MQGFKEYFALGFFQGALLKDPDKVLAQLGQVQAGRVMKFTSVRKTSGRMRRQSSATCARHIAVEKAGLRIERKKDLRFPGSQARLTERFREWTRVSSAAFDRALTPGRQRSYLYHFAQAKQSATRAARIDKAKAAIFEGRGFLERR